MAVLRYQPHSLWTPGSSSPAFGSLRPSVRTGRGARRLPNPPLALFHLLHYGGTLSQGPMKLLLLPKQHIPESSLLTGWSFSTKHCIHFVLVLRRKGSSPFCIVSSLLSQRDHPSHALTTLLPSNRFLLSGPVPALAPASSGF